jgi:hypothetical protein
MEILLVLTDFLFFTWKKLGNYILRETKNSVNNNG